MGLTRDEVQHISALCRVALAPGDLERFQEQLSNILDQFRVLQEVDTSNVLPTAHSVAMENVMREDEPGPSFPQADILANAPRQEEGLFRVKAVLE